MRQVRFLPVLLLTLLLSSCNDNIPINDNGNKEQGALSLSLSVDSEVLISKAEDPEDDGNAAQIALDDFKVEIFRKVSDSMADGVCLYRESYADAKAALIPLDAGDYYLRAKYGDSLGIGFDRPFYMAEQEFTVRPQTRESVSATAKIANVKVSVEFGDYFKEYYPNYYVKVINNDPNLRGYKNSVTFVKEETRSAYIHHGEMTVEVYADFKGDGNWSYYHIDGIDANEDGVISDSEKFCYSPNDHITFNVDAADKLYGNLLVNIKIDNGTVDKSYQAVIPEYKAPQDGPKVSRQAFDVKIEETDGYAYVYEGRDREYNDGQSFSYSAKAGMTACTLTVNSEDLCFTDKTFDLTSASDLKELKDAGIRCSLGQFMGVVDFTDAMKSLGTKVKYVDDTTPCATFSMTVTDEANKTATVEGTLLVWPKLQGTMTIPDYDVWAKRVSAPVVNISKGKPDYCQLQISVDGKKWTTIQQNGYITGNTVTFEDVTGLEPSTDYWFRIFDGEFAVTDKAGVKVTTEDALQLGNPSFEEYRVHGFEFKYTTLVMDGWKPVITTVTKTRYWYDLFNSNSSSDLTQWATNSSATLDKEITPEYLYYKCYPTVTLQTGGAADGNYSVMVASIATTDYGSDAMSGDAKTGEIWIGTADNSGEHKGTHTGNGDKFYSRPSKMTFQHKFSQYNDDPYSVEVQVWDSAKNIIGSGSLSSNVSVEPDWQKAEVSIEYTVKAKASYIYVSFKSSKTGSTKSRKFSGADGLPNTHVEPGGGSASNDPIHAGNILWIDDVKLEY